MLASSDRDETPVADETVFPGYRGVCDDSVTTGSEAPAARAKGVVENTAVLDFREVEDAV